ncbi:hypothetical protein CFP65_3271 [Kitasatospora sp. MMS16-BH015]|uniref:hypothetical protein n=1 Tax=Kitasatospora sp. MMS16-BH015 TaxID=2018025 RepID=UPI000CA099DA|nr:hypothetical protein [Kitasatospora sp. MMS16-BH015]AUG78072.1 hypothetical protein CFP65_3271 [Kitasatospora sp. MMS16-BH015]
MSAAQQVVEFLGPPPVAETKHTRIARALRGRPSEWAVVQRAASIGRAASAAQAIRSARLHAYEPAGAFQAVARTVQGEHRVYARYVGEQAQAVADGGVAA